MRGGRNEALLIVALVALGIVLSRWQTSARINGKIDPITSVARAAIRPTSASLASCRDAVSGFTVALGRGRALEAENRRLREQVGQMGRDAQRVSDLEGEVEELRRLGGWKAGHARRKVPADVIGYFPEEGRIQLNVGSSSGVGRGMPVVTSSGIVARIESCDSSSSQALLVTSGSNEARMTALVQRSAPDPPVAGILRGNGAGLLLLELDDPTSVVDAGDRVVTSGFSEMIPRGLPVGHVVSVDSNPAFGRRVATIMPEVSLGSLRAVVVLK